MEITIKQYLARPGSHISNKAAAYIGPVLQKLAEEGKSTADDIVEEARHPESPLHPHFDWDNQVAADNWRQHQARRIANSVMVRLETPQGKEYVTRAFYPVRIQVAQDNDSPEEDDGLRSYIHLQAVIETPDYSQQVEQDFRQALRQVESRYRIYREVLGQYAPVFQAIDEALGESA